MRSQLEDLCLWRILDILWSVVMVKAEGLHTEYSFESNSASGIQCDFLGF